MLETPGKFTVAAFAVAAALGLGGCSSSHQQPGGLGAPPAGGASTAASAAPSPGAAGASARASASAAAAAAKASASSSATTASSGGNRPSQTAAKAPGRPSGFTRPGGYTYDLRGTAKQPIGGTQAISGTQSYVVDAPSGSTQHAKTTDQQGSEDMTVAVQRTGLYVRDIHIAQQGFNEDFRPSGAAMYFPASYHTGSQWSWRATSTDGKYAIAVTSKISGSSSVTIGGKADKALLVDSTLHITGSGVDITDTQRDWVSTTYALILQEHSVTHGTAYGASFSSDVTRRLRSTTPS